MTCDDKLPLAHALADGELNVIHVPDIEAHVARWAVACRSSAVAEYKPVPHEIVGRGKLIIQSACRIRRLSMPI